jgi:hypothetical protein
MSNTIQTDIDFLQSKSEQYKLDISEDEEDIFMDRVTELMKFSINIQNARGLAFEELFRRIHSDKNS